MSLTIDSPAATCAMPACTATITRVGSVYIDGCGQVCSRCAGPDPEWLGDTEPPF